MTALVMIEAAAAAVAGTAAVGTVKPVLPFWVEIVKVFTPLLTPIVVVILGFVINKRIAGYGARASLDHAIIEKRAEIYAGIQFGLNDIYCYIKRVGNWKDKTPEEIIAIKRTVDQVMYASRPYWSEDLFTQYQSFMYSCFSTYRGRNMDAGIIADWKKYRELNNWKTRYRSLFVEGFDEAKLDDCFRQMDREFSKDFGLPG